MKKILEKIKAFLQEPPVHPVPDTDVPPAGTKMDDGTLYAGLCPHTGRRMFAAAGDSGTWGSKALKLKFDEAASAPDKLNHYIEHGHVDWRLPDREQMEVIAQRKDRIGGFKPGGWYWTSSVSSEAHTWMVYFGPGLGASLGKKLKPARVRCIRLGDVPAPPPEPEIPTHTETALIIRRPLRLKQKCCG